MTYSACSSLEASSRSPAAIGLSSFDPGSAPMSPNPVTRRVSQEGGRRGGSWRRSDRSIDRVAVRHETGSMMLPFLNDATHFDYFLRSRRVADSGAAGVP